MSEVTPFWYWRQRLRIWLRYGLRRDSFLFDVALDDLDRFYCRCQRESAG